MAAYASIADVNALVPQQPFTSQTIPTQAQVEGFLDDISNEINALLPNAGYIAPVVSGVVALRELRRATSYGACGLAQDARSGAVLRDEALGGVRNVWTQRYQDWKKQLVDNKNPYSLTDAPRTDNEVVKPLGRIASDTTDLVDETDYATNPPFRIGMRL